MYIPISYRIITLYRQLDFMVQLRSQELLDTYPKFAVHTFGFSSRLNLERLDSGYVNSFSDTVGETLVDGSKNGD